ncbi:MAG: dehydrogenase [Ignavibacteriae bacterium]|nr:MAG: dehydrogenase [Ignavibacteriota bacterium]
MNGNTKIVVIGLGGVAQLVHLPILSKIKSVKIAAVSELNKTRLKTIAEKFNVKEKYTDYKEMLNHVEFDAAIISTPTNTHKQIAIDCLNSGKDVLVEKPIALSYQEAKEIDDAAKKNKRKVMVGMNFRFRPDAMMLKSLINSGELGDIFYIKCGWARKQSSNQKWFNKKNLSGGGVLLDLGIVLLDTALWLLDFPKIKNVTSQNFSHTRQTVEDSSVGLIRFNSNAVLNYEVSWSVQDETDKFRLSAFGKEGAGYLNPLKAYKKVDSTKVDYTLNSRAEQKNLFRKSYENEIKHFIGAIKDSIPLISSSEEALFRMKLIENLYQSAKNKSEINF